MSASSDTASRLVLPKSVIPKHYNLFIEPDLAKYTYKGQVTIELEVHKPTKEITLNAIDLTFSTVTFGGMNSVNEEHDRDSQVVTWEFPHEVSGKGYLEIHFNGTLNNQMNGFYRSY